MDGVRRATLVSLCIALLCVMVAGCFMGPRRYSIQLYHGPAGQGVLPTVTRSLSTSALALDPVDEIGRVFADDPLWETNGWSAWVVVTDENGVRVYDPEVAWTTDIPECIRILSVPERTDAVEIRPFPGSKVGCGHLYVSYRDAVASLMLVSYGQFELTLSAGEHVSDGWSFELQQIVDVSEADLYITCNPDIIQLRTLHAPYGIQLREEWDNAWTFLEACQEPAVEGFGDAAAEKSESIYEVIGQNGVHYRVSVTGLYSGSDGQRVFLAWAPFW